MKEAPLYVQTHDLARWLLTNVPTAGPLQEKIHQDALTLLDQVVLALQGHDRDRYIDEADATAALLRAHLRLARDLEVLDDRRLLFLAGALDSIGRQLGGWQKRLTQDTLDPRHR